MRTTSPSRSSCRSRSVSTLGVMVVMCRRTRESGSGKIFVKRVVPPCAGDAPSRVAAAEVGYEDHTVAEKGKAGTACHESLLEFQVRNAAFIDTGVERGSDALFDRRLVLTDRLGQTGQGCKLRRGEPLQPVRQRCCVLGIEHGGEVTDQAVCRVQLRAVREQSVQALDGVQTVPRRRGGDPPCDLAG